MRSGGSMEKHAANPLANVGEDGPRRRHPAELSEDTGMFRPTGKWKKKRDRWHMRLLRRLYLSRKFCSLCERHRDDQPNPLEQIQFVEESAAALVYQTTRFGRKQFSVRVGRWNGLGNKGMHLSELLEKDDLSDLIAVVFKASEYIEAQSSRKRFAR